jgi:hypothetical protein
MRFAHSLPAGRRRFLKVGLLGTALLATAHLLGNAYAAPVERRRVIDERARRIVKALVPIVLEGMLPTGEAERARATDDIAAAFEASVTALGAAAQDDLSQLFTFLDFAPTRLAFAGLWQPVEKCSPAELRDFLQRWRFSRVDVQQASYQALTQLIQASWYDMPASWPAIGYPGPPKIA